MLRLYRSIDEKISIFNEKTKEQCIITVLCYEGSLCTLSIDDGNNNDVLIRGIPQTVEIEISDCTMSIINIDRGVKFGFVAPDYVKINRIKQ